MKLLRIKRNNELAKDIYTTKLSDTSLLNFAFASIETKTENGNKYKFQTTKFMTCREIACAVIKSHLHKLNYCGFKYIIDMQTTRIIFAADDSRYNKTDSKNNIFIAKRLINILEDYMGISNSIIATVKHTEFETKTNMWLLTGPKDWIHSPQLLSLFLLLFRFCFYNTDFTKTLFDTELNMDTLITKINEYIIKFEKEKETVSKQFQAVLDVNYLKIILPYLKRLLKNYKQIFEGESLQYYPEKGFNGYGGIDTLFKKNTDNAALNKRFSHYVLKEQANV